jgi:hypothetical protein
LKLAHFGSLRLPPTAKQIAAFGLNARGSLRHDGNVLGCSGIELDYDGSGNPPMPFAEAVRRLNDADIAFIAHTTASHTAASPHWRILAWFSQELPSAERGRMINRGNGVIGGVAHRESWTLSQVYHIGRVDGVDFEIVLGDSDRCIDQADELDAGALPYQPTGPGPTQGGRGKGGKARPDCSSLSEADLKELIKGSVVYYDAGFELATRWAYQGIPEADAEANLNDLFDEVPAPQQDRQWQKAKASIDRWIQKAYARVAKRKGTAFRALVMYLANDDQLRGAIRLNLFTQQIEVVDPFPPQLGQPLLNYRALLDPEDRLKRLGYRQIQCRVRGEKARWWFPVTLPEEVGA